MENLSAETLSAFQQKIRNDKVQVMIGTDQYMGTRTTGLQDTAW